MAAFDKTRLSRTIEPAIARQKGGAKLGTTCVDSNASILSLDASEIQYRGISDHPNLPQLHRPDMQPERVVGAKRRPNLPTNRLSFPRKFSILVQT